MEGVERKTLVFDLWDIVAGSLPKLTDVERWETKLLRRIFKMRRAPHESGPMFWERTAGRLGERGISIRWTEPIMFPFFVFIVGIGGGKVKKPGVGCGERQKKIPT